MVKKALQKEISHFKELSPLAQRLLISYGLFQIVSPLIVLFTNAFLWRQSQDSTTIAIYNTTSFLMLPVSFYLSGVILRYVKAVDLYWFGCIAQAFATVLLMFFPSTSYWSIALYGAIAGIGSGLYWPVLINLSMVSTNSNNRMYFSAIQSASSMIIGIVIPIFFGWIIAFGDSTHFYSAETAYRFLIIVALFVLGYAGYFLHPFKMEKKGPKNIIMRNVSKRWTIMRYSRISEGIVNGIVIFIPTILVMHLVGNEGILGTIQSVIAILGAIAVYCVGRWVDVSKRLLIVAVGIGIYVIGGLGMALFYSQVGVILYLIAQTIYGPLKQAGASSISMDTIDEEKEMYSLERFQFIFDQELFLNIGRIIGTTGFMLSIYFLSLDNTLKYFFIILALIQISFVYFLYILDKTSHTHSPANKYVSYVDHEGDSEALPLKEQ